MFNPSIDKLLNIVDSKYMLVHVVSQRSKQMLEHNHFQMVDTEYKNIKALGKAMEELDKGMISIVDLSKIDTTV